MEIWSIDLPYIAALWLCSEGSILRCAPTMGNWKSSRGKDPLELPGCDSDLRAFKMVKELGFKNPSRNSSELYLGIILCFRPISAKIDEEFFHVQPVQR